MVPPDFLPNSASRSVTDVASLVEAVARGDLTAQATYSRALTATPQVFRTCFPTILQWVASGDDGIKKLAADMLRRRAHWIPARDLNEFFVPVVMFATPRIGDGMTRDLLVAAALSTAPAIGTEHVLSLASVADTHLRDERGVPVWYQTSIGLLAERMPLQFATTVSDATSLVVEEYRQALLHGEGSRILEYPYSAWRVRVSSTSLFAQRGVIGGRFSTGKRTPWGETLMEECKRYIQALSQLSQDGRAPDWAGAYHLLFTALIVLPGLDPVSRRAAEATRDALGQDCPVVSDVITRLLQGDDFEGDLRSALNEFDCADVEQHMLFTTALMDTIRGLQLGTRDVNEVRASILDGELSEVLKRVDDPLLAYLVAELRRFLHYRWAELFTD